MEIFIICSCTHVTIIYDKQILTEIWQFCLKNDNVKIQIMFVIQTLFNQL